MASADLLFELGTEEIPAGFLAKAIVDLAALAEDRLKTARLEHRGVTVVGAPRRLALSVAALADRQADVSETVTGPPASAAFDKEGKPTKAAIGFAQKLGVDPSALTTVEVAGKGAYVAARREQRGEETRSLLPKILGELVRAIPWKKSMRWAWLDDSFVRPLHWIVAIYGGDVVPLEAFGVKSGRTSRGHRFLAPAAVELVGTLDDYRTKLRRAFVVVDQVARRTEIEAELRRVEKEMTNAAGESNPPSAIVVRRDEALLDEVTNLVEYPRAVWGSFEPRHLSIPAEVIVSAMRAHQRYFATETADGKLTNRFVTIAGTVTKDGGAVRHGNERVLAARLADAAFFHDEDLASSWEEWHAKLQGAVFQAKLGTIAEKIDRIRKRVDTLAHLPPDVASAVSADDFDRAAYLCKLDLASKMVGEFPDLQGVMGRHYAHKRGERAAVAEAIFEHYLPRGAADKLPSGVLGALIGVADRMDTIVGCFAVGLAPTGSNDAFGLRRAALAVLNILLDRGWAVPLGLLIDGAAKQLEGKIKWSADLRAQVLEFFKTRLRGILVDGRGLAGDCVDAALAAGFDDPVDAAARATAVAHLRDRADFEPLGIAFKRVANILKGEQAPGAPIATRFTHDSERALWSQFEAVSRDVGEAVEAGDYDLALRHLTSLKGAVDKFFDDVLVMDPDLAVKQNRLNLLGTINATFLRIADFRQLAVK